MTTTIESPALLSDDPVYSNTLFRKASISDPARTDEVAAIVTATRRTIKVTYASTWTLVLAAIATVFLVGGTNDDIMTVALLALAVGVAVLILGKLFIVERCEDRLRSAHLTLPTYLGNQVHVPWETVARENAWEGLSLMERAGDARSSAGRLRRYGDKGLTQELIEQRDADDDTADELTERAVAVLNA